MRAKPWRVVGSITGDNCQILPAIAAVPPIGVTIASVPIFIDARSCSATRACISILPSSAMRNSTLCPPITIWPGSTERVRTRPPAGARIDSRALRANCSPNCALATAARATAESRAAVLASISALEMKPFFTSAIARVRFDCASAASACAERTLAAALAACWVCTDRSTIANAWPAFTPVAGIDQHLDDHAAFADRADRHVVAGRR